MHILVVDDERVICESLQFFLKKGGHQVNEANDAMSALEILEKEAIQVCLLDIRMPGASGVELLEQAKARFPEVYYIMVTGNADMESALACLRLGAYNYLRKPVNLEELLTNLDRIDQREKMKKEIEDNRKRIMFAEKITAVGTLSTGLAHSLNNPLTFLKGNYEQIAKLCMMILDRMESDGMIRLTPNIRSVLESLPELLESQKKAIERIESIQKRILSVREGMAMEDRIRIKDLVSATFETILVELFSKTKCPVVLDCEGLEERVVKSSRSALSNIFQVLFTNAIESVVQEGGGQVMIESAKRDDGCVELRIRDSGPGIPREIRDNVFMPFYSNKEHGLGFGLYFAYWLSSQIGGALYLEYEGDHSVFILKFRDFESNKITEPVTGRWHKKKKVVPDE